MGAVTVLFLLRTAIADEFCLEMSRPACGKVCKLVCETRRLTSIGYGSKCKSICLPDPSRAGCKHGAICYGKCDDKPGDCCPNCQPKCEFCWRDWFACGCAQPRMVHVLTKYQAEKKICWYHWEVVDAACCDCAEPTEAAGMPEKKAAKNAGRMIYKLSPEDAQLGDVLPVTDEEWVKLAAVLSPDPTEGKADAAAQIIANAKGSEAAEPTDGSKSLSIAEWLQQFLRK